MESNPKGNKDSSKGKNIIKTNIPLDTSQNSDIYKQFCREIIEEVKRGGAKDQEAFNKIKSQIIRKYKTTYHLKEIPKNIDITSFATNEERKEFKSLFTIKPTRTISGVATIAIMPKPIACRHGKCTYCPGGPGSVFGNVPQSYTGTEPATRRAIRNAYDPYLQVSNRLEQYLAMNKVPDKIELIVMGGTFTSFPLNYQEEFIKYAYKAMNDFSENFFDDNVLDIKKFNKFFRLPGSLKDDARSDAIQNDLLKLKGEDSESVSLEEEQKKNETAKIRIVALCLETRPDWSKEAQIDMMLKQGTTRVEIGVQTVYNSVLDRIKRMHTVEDTILATQLLKDSFLKIGYHMMPGLPGVSKEQDIYSLRQIIENPNFMPDALKLYPCMVMKGTELYDEWKRGEFNPLSTEESAEIISEFKRHVPTWLRIMRVQRDIPTFMTEKGVDRTNLRQYVEKKLHEKNISCKCVRCREPKDKIISWDDVKVLTQTYQASGGTEIFISSEDTKNDILLGFTRLRIPGIGKAFRPEITPNTSGIRELHVYGQAVDIGSKGVDSKDASVAQHKGIGKQLLAQAEKIAIEEYNMKKMLVISGIGVREYYKKLGYKLEGSYMGKKLP